MSTSPKCFLLVTVIRFNISMNGMTTQMAGNIRKCEAEGCVTNGARCGGVWGGVFRWLECNRVKRQLLTSVAFSTAGIAPSMRRGKPQRSGGRGAAVGQNNVALHIAITERSTMDRSPSHLLRVVNLTASRALPNIPLQSPCHSIRIFVMITMW
jgi:hypothetical protein